MTTNQTLRIPNELVPLLDKAAQEQGISRHQLILDALEEQFSLPGDLDPDLVIGYMPLLSGEIVAEDIDCPECGMPLERPHIGWTAGVTGPIPFGPVCWICATTD